ncbi:MAG: orotidine 5'-phosphate decarboxylase [Gallionellales bacterium 35-53-114]|jgi:orotidine-5'-phosphate decarboxylase|nr:MAG: orotidine 5'-phosphate decarboxylase [Gallionellales bacterium 35-53-114]OYZ65330.1 MAG: orotidine 5'-phosphate decarboxylase [Gallionellales bacterium 24-53-125]OZB08237.1 MAG: orotidine 5'-phosphate decarboxylase [Gallionellales bacterium 39-52-133]HQS58167.1 orotidine-5'-phosphate decarboxylase [Gallionellaceae bacterium]HQS73722.1 orotidine-5'-phosphate decarboxylase [Gallionellaceae bacterium]
MSDPKIIVALDYPEARPALELVSRLQPALCRLKIGKELFTAAGPQMVEQCMQRGFEVFLDLKFHDIPNTTAQACKAAASLGVWMVNVHALGGRKMMEAARDAVASSARPPKLIAVTVLTSMAQEDLAGIGITATPAEMVLRLATLARDSGMDGVVCSAQEAALLRQHCGSTFNLVTPGIRPADAAADDQSRIMTPAAALKNGSSYLVIGRPITKAADPLLALQNISREIGEMA